MGRMDRPPFIVVEGVEGAGKSTQVDRLRRRLEARGIPSESGREPGGTPAGEAIREILLGDFGGEIAPETELFLMLAARSAFVRERVRPALEAGRAFLADRFDYSTLAYQGYGRGIPLSSLREANRVATGGLRPDVYLVLDVEVDEGARRRQAEGGRPDRIESEGKDFLLRVREGYRELAAGDEAAELVDGAGDPDDVEARIRDVLRARLPETFGSGAG